LKNLQITLTDAPPPVVDGYVAAFVPFVRTGNLIHLSGRLAQKTGKLWCGKLGEEITTAEGEQAARSVAIELLATLEAAIGDLSIRALLEEPLPSLLFSASYAPLRFALPFG
jgi:enamine deaminase RidA (YjgF/YER057c/UK114 family)